MRARPVLPRSLSWLVPLAACLLAACGPARQEPASAAPPPTPVAEPARKPDTTLAHDAAGIAWRQPADGAEVDALFAEAKQAGKPVFVYWGASWCPPCNQVKATLFNRQDFIERSRAFVPIYIDGDRPGAQKLGARFRVSGYPTMVLFNPQGEELTRLPGEVEASRYNEVLDLGMNAARPVKALVADALGAKPTLRPDDWRLLAYYSWDTDEKVITGETAQTLAKLAAACPPELEATATRLRLKAYVAADEKQPLPAVDAASRERVLAALADPARVREQADLVLNHADDIAKALAPRAGQERQAVVRTLETALVALQSDVTLSRADRVQALISRVDLARLDAPRPQPGQAVPALPAPLVADVRAMSAAYDREITDGYERQAVITAAAYLLDRAGLGAESDALLEANLAKSHSPYYLMSGLASNARRRGDAPKAIEWSRKAWETSQGPATRLQWGSSYLATLVDLAPGDETRIEETALAIWREGMAQPDAFHQRSERSLQRVARKLAEWGRGVPAAGAKTGGVKATDAKPTGAHAAAAERTRASLRRLCDGAGDVGHAPAPGRADAAEACRRLLDPAPSGSRA